MRQAAWLAFLLAVTGCSSVGGSAVRTGPVHLGAYTGPVAIYATGRPPPNAVDLGVVEVHAAQQEATVEMLFPQFLEKVASIGGNIAVIEGTRARFEIAGRTHVEQFYYTCNLGATCSGTRVYSTNDEMMVLSMFGRAMTTLVPAPAGGPLLPAGEAAPPPAAPPGSGAFAPPQPPPQPAPQPSSTPAPTSTEPPITPPPPSQPSNSL